MAAPTVNSRFDKYFEPNADLVKLYYRNFYRTAFFFLIFLLLAVALLVSGVYVSLTRNLAGGFIIAFFGLLLLLFSIRVGQAYFTGLRAYRTVSAFKEQQKIFELHQMIDAVVSNRYELYLYSFALHALVELRDKAVEQHLVKNYHLSVQRNTRQRNLDLVTTLLQVVAIRNGYSSWREFVEQSPAVILDPSDTQPTML